MLSAPAPIPISIIPALIWLATSIQACRLDAHCRLSARTAVSSVKPATKAAARNSVAPAPGASTLPTAISSTRAGLILERSRTAFRTPARRSPAGVSLKPPLPPFVKAVRQATVTTTYCDVHVSILVCIYMRFSSAWMMKRAYIVGVLLQQLLAATSSGIARDLASDLRDSCDGYSAVRVSFLVLS